MDLRVSIGGFVVGALIGLTGMGGGSIMTPMLIFLFNIHPTTAVGTDLLYASITKLVGAVQHIRQRTVDFTVVMYLALGSVPGAALGSLGIGWMEHHLNAAALDLWMSRILGGVYILAIAAMLWRWWRSRHADAHKVQVGARPPAARLVVLGLVAGTIVGATSIGSGSILVAMLGLLYPMAAARMVGTDVVQGVLVTAVAALVHFAFGNVDLGLAASILIGSIPGILLGSRLTARLPEKAIQAALLMMLGWSSWNLLMK
ncbi:MAG: sulfite exporter TauE/SafE family protein [Alicyclobacillus herbarius]|uniref:sulfite exporter TauE/SafE family protein n=1 Tax=Alicyclobacillus herbarius TaxID=122960 RepID=UPI0023548547|nr:sulfite exporter TauE/SafE family protein [Alicyclobacillus herbarius]MCL6632918.1 sulfite exporter TauE/SafE family protein [Alicyclobacillus herbarius]